MRDLLAGELTQAQDWTSDDYVKLEVQNGSGTWIDVGAALGTHWIIDAAWGEVRDTQVSQVTLTLVQQIGDKTHSLAPLMSTSVLNVDDAAAYSPLLEIGRLMRMSTATMAHNVALDVAKYRKMFEGRIDDVSSADSVDWLGPVTIVCSDLGGWLMDLQIETDGVQYGDPSSPPSLLSVLQAIVDDNLPAGDPAVTVVKTSLSNFAVTDYKQGMTKVLEALTALVLDTTGEDIRYRFNASHVSTLQWFDPGRTADWSASTAYVVGDRVLSGSTYYKCILAHTNHVPPNGTYWATAIDATFASYTLRTLARSLANIRNAGQMAWSDGLVNAESSGSIASYRRRWFNLPASVFITTEAEAQAVIDAVVNDLSGAPEEATVELPYFWPVQLFDLYTFSANNRQYDQDQILSVVGFRHSIENGRGSTTLTVAGRVVGAYAAWRRRIGVDVAVPENDISLNGFRWVDAADGTTRTFSMIVGKLVNRVAVFVNTVAVPVLTDPWPSASADPATEPDRVTPKAILVPDPITRIATYVVTLPTFNTQAFVQFEPRMADWTSGPVRRVPIDSKILGESGQGTVSVDTNGAWSWSVDGPTAQDYVKYAESTSAFPSDAAAAAGTTISGRQITRTGGTPLTFGQTIYVTVIPYTSSGDALPSIRLRGSYQTFTATKTVYFGVGSMVEFTSPQIGYTLSSGALSLKVSASPQTFGCLAILPDGCTATDCYADVSNGDPIHEPNAQTVTFAKVSGGGTATTLGTSTQFAFSGLSTFHLTFSQLTTGLRFLFTITLLDEFAAGDLKFNGFYLTYTIPNPQVAV